MGVEVRVRLVGPQNQNPALQVLLFDVLYLFVHQQSLREVFKLSPESCLLNLAFPPDFGVNLQENLEISCHHVGERVAVCLHLLQFIVDLLNLMVLLELALLRKILLQLSQQHLQLRAAFLPVLLDVGPLLEQRQEVAPDQVAADRNEAEYVSVLAILVDEVEGRRPAEAAEHLLVQVNNNCVFHLLVDCLIAPLLLRHLRARAHHPRHRVRTLWPILQISTEGAIAITAIVSTTDVSLVVRGRPVVLTNSI